MPPSVLMRSLQKIWPQIDAAGIPVAIAGGIAMSFWGHPRSTQDINLLSVCADSENLTNLLRKIGLKKLSPAAKDLGLCQLSTWSLSMDEDYMDVEIDTLTGNSIYYHNLVKRFVEANIDGMQTTSRVISREDLILHKLYAERLIDQADVISLTESHGAELDQVYLSKWIEELGLQENWNEIQRRMG
ncbi:hypothetical protein LF1_31180 [Rubripirellula obstinata]|uniref:Nucleotidyltransferase n=2 Tax=Rubripirellula obstinata TaxID=406547 RepID=A0A5B1CHB0_9BACT|nr:hypothetical protein LF1_31180 [Rubripirellula obstinata]